jgi:hypothetical protein
MTEDVEVKQKKKRKVNDGKQAELIVRNALKFLETNRRATHIRLYDTTSAGNLMPDQPGDYIVHMGIGCLLEVKSSIEHDTLSDCVMRNTFTTSQMLGARMWLRSKAAALVIFHKKGSDFVELWETARVVEAFYSPTLHWKLQGKPFKVVSKHSQFLAEAIELFIKTSM